MLIFGRLVDLFRLAGKFALGSGAVGVATNLYGAVVLIANTKASGWLWVSLGMFFLALSFLSVGYEALAGQEQAEEERDKANEEPANQPPIKAAVYGHAEGGGTGIVGSVHGEIHEHPPPPSKEAESDES